MVEHQVLFRDAMVQAILSGDKTHTRRFVKGNKNPLGVPGDHLWVREAFAVLAPGSYLPVKPNRYSRDGCDVRYRATDPLSSSPADVRGYKWHPSLHMPRWASRITLLNLHVRSEPIQAISDADALKEGVGKLPFSSDLSPKEKFAALWISTYGSTAWDDNPLVWVTEFSVYQIKEY